MLWIFFEIFSGTKLNYNNGDKLIHIKVNELFVSDSYMYINQCIRVGASCKNFLFVDPRKVKIWGKFY